MKISFCTIAFQKNKWGKEIHAEKPLRDILPLIATAGYDGAELWWGHISELSANELADTARQLRDLQLAVPMISPYFNFTTSDESAAESLVAARQAIAIARQLDARAIRCFTGRTASKDATPEQWARTVRCLQTLADETKADGIRWCFETHDWNLMDTIPSTRRLVESIGRDNVRLILQPSTFHDDWFNATRELAPLARHVHATNIRANEKTSRGLEDGDMDWRQIIASLNAAGYQDYISVEWFDTEQVVVALQREAKYLRQLLCAPATTLTR
jgi:sugar phosphate isomerase/epimerase